MKKHTILSLLFIPFLIGSCIKEELPPTWCSPILFKFEPLGNNGNIDSMLVSLKRSTDGENLDTMIYNPTTLTHTESMNFCGPFTYKIRIYNQATGSRFIFRMWVNAHLQAEQTLNDNEIIEGVYTFNSPL